MVLPRARWQESFVRWLKEKYGMALALHTPLAPWTDPTEYPVEARRMEKAGNRLGELCTASPVYMETKIARLKELCKKGAYFLMYDGSWFPGECWDKSHGHSLPATHQEHLDAILKLQQELHKEYPNVLIEQHDPMTGPGTVRYVPTYFMHAKPGAFDELWGYEYMWDVVNDIVVHLAPGADPDAVRHAVTRVLPGARLITKADLLATADSFLDWRRGLPGVLVLAMALALVIVAADKPTALSVEEQREMGILRALGWSKLDVLVAKAWESLAVSVTAVAWSSHGSYGLRSGSRPERSSAPIELP